MRLFVVCVKEKSKSVGEGEFVRTGLSVDKGVFEGVDVGEAVCVDVFMFVCACVGVVDRSFRTCRMRMFCLHPIHPTHAPCLCQRGTWRIASQCHGNAF